MDLGAGFARLRPARWSQRRTARVPCNHARKDLERIGRLSRAQALRGRRIGWTRRVGFAGVAPPLPGLARIRPASSRKRFVVGGLGGRGGWGFEGVERIHAPGVAAALSRSDRRRWDSPGVRGCADRTYSVLTSVRTSVLVAFRVLSLTH